MEYKNEVCSLEYAKELKKLGVKQDSLFYWNLSHYPVEYNLLDNEGKRQAVKLDNGYGIPRWNIERNCASRITTKSLQCAGMIGTGKIKDSLISHINEKNKRISYSAFTFTELWNKLFPTIRKGNHNYELLLSIILFVDFINHECDKKPIKNSLVNAVARLYIYKIKNQLIENEN